MSWLIALVQEQVLKETIHEEDKHFLGLRMLGNWFKVLWRLNDDQIQQMNGTDYTLYLIFLRFSAWFCLVITVLNCLIYIPIYVTGKPNS
jgi:hypothetical protein